MTLNCTFFRGAGGRIVWMGAALLVAAVVCGCASRGRQSIASGARMVKDGRGVLTYRAPDAGDVYVYNQGTGKLVYMGAITKALAVEVDPAADQVKVGGNVVSSREMPDKDAYRIYYRYRVVE